MTTLVVPALDQEPWPSLGQGVCDFIEQRLVFGPGDLRGRPAVLDDEKRALIYRAYEVFPKGHPQAGKRRFKRVTWSLRKGSAKTELAAWLAAVELHPDGPVRCDGFRGKKPIGRPVMDPYIPMVAYTEEQSEDLAYGALYAVISESSLADDFDVGLERIMRLDGRGKAVALANAPDARDGARTTFQHFDETHRFVLPRLKEAHRTMLANIPKRPIADPWSLETTTMYSPGESSVAEATHDYARRVNAGEIPDSRLFFFHRQASDKHDLTTTDGLRAAIIEASGPVAAWSDIDSIAEQFREPDADRAYLERVWLNRPTRSADKAFDAVRWGDLVKPHTIPKRAMVTAGFDGSRHWDATALVVTEITTGHQELCALWQRPEGLRRDDAWEVPIDEVNAAIDRLFTEYEVWRVYMDPSKWEQSRASWAGKYGEKVVLEWPPTRVVPTARAIRGYANAILNGELSHADDRRFAEHIGNAHRRYITQRDDDGAPLWLIQKERPDSVHKIDGAAAGWMSWQARLEAVAAGVGTPKEILVAWR